VLTDNKRAWHSHLKFALWANRINTKRSTGISPFQLIYGIDVVLPINLAFPVMKLLQDSEEEPNDLTRRMNQLIEVQQTREQVNEKFQEYQDKMKSIFDRRAKQRNFIPGDLVLRWDSRREDHGKHGKFDHLWLGPYKIVAVEGNNSFSLQNLEGDLLEFPVNGRFLKHFIQF
jgi:hypothetical protein